MDKLIKTCKTREELESVVMNFIRLNPRGKLKIYLTRKMGSHTIRAFRRDIS